MYFEGDMVNTFSTFFDEFGDRAFRVGCYEQFYFALPDLEERSCNVFAFNGFRFIMFGTQQFAEEFVAGSQVAYGDADMFDAEHGFISF